MTLGAWGYTAEGELFVSIDTRGLEMRCVAMDDAGIVAGGKDGLVHSWRFTSKDVEGDADSWFLQRFRQQATL